MSKHFVAMAGLHGCLPNYCECYDTFAAAVEGLASLHELGQKRRRELRITGSLELNCHRDGNEYCEIVECTCPRHSSHL
jgi:hypothetical protein